MTDQTNADIARRLREYAQQLRGSTHVRHTGADLIERAAAALESLVQERDRLDEAFDRDLPWRYDEVEAQRNQFAAIVEQARLYCENQGDKFRHHAGRILDMLASAPADALLEVKAKAWDEGVNAEARAAVTASPRIKNPYRAREEER